MIMRKGGPPGGAKLQEERDGGREEDGEMMIAVRWAAARWRVKASATTPWRFGSTAAGEAASTSFGNKEEAWYASEEGGLSFR